MSLHTKWLRLEGISQDHQTPCSEQVAPGHTQSGFEYFKGLKVYNLSEQYVPVFYQPLSIFVFLCLNEVSYISVCAHFLLSCHCVHLSQSGSIFFTPSLSYLCTQAFAGLELACSCLSFTEESSPEVDPKLQACLTKTEEKGYC